MLHIEVEDPVIVQRHHGELGPKESTHHYCTLGLTPQGTAIVFYAMHPDIGRPEEARVPVDVAGSTYPVYKFEPHRKDPDYPWPNEVVYARSEDGGRSWSDPLPIEGRGCAAVGGRLLSFCHYLYHAESGVAVASLLESDDDGRTWVDRPGVLFRYPANLDPCLEDRFFAGASSALNMENVGTPTTLADGSLLVFATAHKRAGDKVWWFPLLFSSTDGGYHFDFVSYPTGTQCPADHHGFTEPTLAQLANGDLLAVFRTEYHRPDRVLMQCRSSDGGQTWTEPIVAPGTPRHYPLRALQPILNTGKTHGNAASVSPALTVMPSGIAAMVYGRPGVHLTLSEDGSGSLWHERIPVVPEPSLFGHNCDGSAMAGIVSLGGSELLMVYDVRNYRPADGGPAGNTVFSLRLHVERS